MSETRDPVASRWARLRFSVVGHLLMAPPARGELQAALLALARREWRHPVSGEPVRFGVSTIERWYYAARAQQNPMPALVRRRRRDRGRQRAVSPALAAALEAQYASHPTWSKQLHYDNLAVRVEAEPDLGPLPSYPTLARLMRSRGLQRQPRRRGSRAPRPRHEVRSYEVSRSHQLWHCKCCGPENVAERSLRRVWTAPSAILRNIVLLHRAFRKAISPVFSFHGRVGPSSAASQSANAFAFISRSISA